MFERLNTPQDAYNHKLGAALEMEKTVLKMLEDNIEHAKEESVRQLLTFHKGETEEHVRNIEDVFSLFRWDVDDSPCPAIQGIQKEGKANVKKTDEAIVDMVILQGAVETEHHEIAVYENLISASLAMGRKDAAALLRANLEQERGALVKLGSVMEQLGARMVQTSNEEMAAIAGSENE